jgi:Ser/Thr protein kinase RdoA (MazF antagonist)
MNQTIQPETIIQILEKYYPQIIKNAKNINILDFNQGYMNFVCHIDVQKEKSKKSYVLIFYNSNRYEGIYQASQYLNEANIPTRTAYENSKGELITEIELDGTKRLIGLYNFLPGKTIPWEAYTRRHLHSLGREMAKIHNIWSKYRNKTQYIPHWKQYLEVDSERLLSYLLKNKEVINKKLSINIDIKEIQKLTEELLEESQNKKEQLIHADFVRSNILFDNKKIGEYYEITGILDFEKVIYAPLEVDLGRTLAFLIVDCKYKDQKEVEKRFLKEGYMEEIENTQVKENIIGGGLKQYMLYFWVRDFWKLLQCNPYEDLNKNEHYIRTIEILINQNILN